MRIFQCDVCGDQPASLTVRSSNHGEVDFCSVGCLQDWAVDAAVEEFVGTLVDSNKLYDLRGWLRLCEDNPDGHTEFYRWACHIIFGDEAPEER